MLVLSLFGKMPASLSHFVLSRKVQDSIANDLSTLPWKLSSFGVGPPAHALGAELSQELKCHHQAGPDWPRAAQLMLPRIRPTSIEYRLNFLEAIDS